MTQRDNESRESRDSCDSHAASGPFDTDVVIVGSGFGGAVAALRFAEAGQRVLVLERGDWVRREQVAVGPSLLWKPERGWFGMNDLQSRGATITPWLGAGVGGGSHVFAGTLKRTDDFSGYPAPIRTADMTAYFERAERMMEARPHPRTEPYGGCRATELMLDAGDRLREREPGLVEEHGLVPLAMQFAGPGERPGATVHNAHGAAQRTVCPGEQSLLGGDIGSKNSLDHNYLHRAAALGAEIQPLTEVDRIERLPLAGYRVHVKRWMPGASQQVTNSLCARRVVLAAGAIGSTEILMRNRDVHGTLPDLSPTLGTRYTTNGNFMSLIVPFRGWAVAWLGFAVLIAGLVIGSGWLALAGAVAYYLQLALARRPFEPDLGTTNSDYMKLRGRVGGQGSVYIESGRYPTPLRLLGAMLLSALGWYRPSRYRWVVRASRLLSWVPPFGALARSWPIPLLQMGRDDALGTMQLDDDGRVTIDYDVRENRAFYDHLDRLGRKVARACHAVWVPNLLHRITGRLEVPHNQGGVPMGESARDGVVDHAGRVFGYRDLMVLDGSTIPHSTGPNPALTILALTERATDVAIAQLHDAGTISAEMPTPRAVAAA